jgi:hypothetical protein
MLRRGSVSFVVEVKRRRFPKNGATTTDLDRKSGSARSPIGGGGLSVTPRIERAEGSDPTIEAAKIAAKWFFSKPGSPQSAGADHWIGPGARGFIPRVEPAWPANVAVQKLAGDLVASPPGQSDGQAEKPRSGRILQSLIVEDPIDALLRRKAEERSDRRRPRGPRVRSVTPDEAAVPTDSRRSPAHKMPAIPSTGFAESAVSTDIVRPGRELRGRTVVTDPAVAVDMPRGKTERRRKKKAMKAPSRTGSLRRTAKERSDAKRRARKRAAGGRFGKKGVAKRAAAKKGAGKVAIAKKTTVRKGRTKGSIGRPALAKKRSAARRTVTTASGRKLASRKIAKTKKPAAGRTKKTKRSAASATETATRSRQQATRRARRSR